MKKCALLLASLLSFVNSTTVFAENAPSLTYEHTNFNQQQPGWADTLTIYNETSQPITIKQLQFDTNNNLLDTSQLYGSIYHSATPAIPQKINDFVYRYSFATQSSYNQAYVTIPAKGSVNLTQIPIAHEQRSEKGIPVYYRMPFNIHVTLQNNAQLSVSPRGQCVGKECEDPAPNKIIGAYFTDWANYHYSNNPQNMLFPNQIPLKNLNTIFYAIGKIDHVTAAISVVDINHDQYYLPAFDMLRQQYPYLNVFYSFGGWGDAGSNSYPSYDLAAIFDQQNPALIQTLATNLVNTMLTMGFNGIDIDYEWTAVQPGTDALMKLTPTRALGYQHLLQAIRQQLNKIQPPENTHYYKLTTAVFSGVDKVQDFVDQGGDWRKVAEAVDALSIMTYDMHGQFDLWQTSPDNITDFQSGMQTEHHYQFDTLNHYNVTDAIEAYHQYGVPNQKMILGLPAYTRIEKTALPVTDENKGLYLTLANDQPSGEAGAGGTVDYKCIVNSAYCWGGFDFHRDTLTYVPIILSGNTLGSLAKTPWSYDKNLHWFMSFDDGQSALYKARWAKQHQLGGIMMWEIDGDIPLTDLHYEQNSVIYNNWVGLTS